MAKKKLLIYAHYYVPDTASTGQILRELAEGMLDQFDITVICVVPSYLGTIEPQYKTKRYYEEEINGVKVLRIRVPEFSKTSKKSRVKNILSYFFGAMGATFRVGRMDYVFSISQPPILGGLLGVWGKWVKRAKFIYNIQDFNPEQVMAVGYTKSKFITNAMMWFDKFSCKRSDLVITVGRDLVETVEKRFEGKKVPKTVMINNWIDEHEIYPLASDNEKVIAFKKKYGLDGKFVIMYSGNIGLYYDLENLNDDNFPTTNLEAIACGTPVITYKTGGSPETLFPDNGWVTEKGDISAVIDIIESGKRKKVLLPDKFKKESMIAEYLKLYNTVYGT